MSIKKKKDKEEFPRRKMGQDILQREHSGQRRRGMCDGEGWPGQHACPSSGTGRPWRSLGRVMR